MFGYLIFNLTIGHKRQLERNKAKDQTTMSYFNDILIWGKQKTRSKYSFCYHQDAMTGISSFSLNRNCSQLLL